MVELVDTADLESVALRRGSSSLSRGTKHIEANMKISDKLVKVNESFTINRYDNGYMIEVGGRTSSEDYKNAKVLVQSVDELLELVREAVTMELDD